MIIDCHGHYTTAPRELEAYRQQQIDGLNDPSEFSSEAPKITDDQIRAMTPEEAHRLLGLGD